MPITISHVLSATTPDNPAFEIRPSHWNSQHALTLNLSGTDIIGAFSNDAAVNVSFSTNGGGYVIASANVTAAPSPVNVTGDNGSSVNAQTIAFLNSNGMTLGVSTAANGASITGSYTVPTQSAQTVGIYHVGNTTGQSSSSTADARTISIDGAGIVSAGWSNGSIRISATQSNQAFSADASSTFQTLTLQDSNGISFSNNAGAIRITHGLQFTSATSAITSAAKHTSLSAVSAYALGNTTQSSSGTMASSSLQFGGSGAVSVGVTGGTVLISAPNTIAQSNQSLGIYASSNTSWASSSSTYDARSLTIVASDNISLGWTNGSLAIKGAAGGGGSQSVGMSTQTAGGATAGTTGYASGSAILYHLVPGSNITMSQSVNGASGTMSIYAPSPGAAVENNWFTLAGDNTAGNTTASGSSVMLSVQGPLTISGTNASQIKISAPALTSLVGTGGVTLSSNGSTISISLINLSRYEKNPPFQTGSTTYLQPIGQWWFQPFDPESPISGGRLNFSTQFGSTSQLPRGTTSASWGSNTSGQKSMRYQYSLSAALYSNGAGGNSTRLESVWSGLHSFEISHNISISGAAGPNMTVSMGVTMSGLSNIDSAGGSTTTTYGGSSTIASAASNINSTGNSSILSSVNNMLSNSLILPIPFNTTINGGQYILGIAWSTASTTGGSSQIGFSVINGHGFLRQTNITAHRMWGRTTTNVSSAILPGIGAYANSSAAPPSTIAYTDLRTLATNAVPYVNWVNSNAMTI